MNQTDLVRMSIKNITVETTESPTLDTLLGGDNKTVSLAELEPMIIQAAVNAPSTGGYDKVFMILNFINGESRKFRMDLTTENNDLVVDINACIAAQ